MKQTFELRGLREAIVDLGQVEKTVAMRVQKLVHEYTKRIAREARAQAPRDAGDLRSSISAHLKGLVGSVVAGEGLDTPEVAAYVEFGTGSKVRVPPGLEQYAMRFYVSGKGRMPANPYLFPAFERHVPAFLKDLRRVLSEVS